MPKGGHADSNLLMLFSLLNAHHLRGRLRLSHVHRVLSTCSPYSREGMKESWSAVRSYSANVSLVQSTSPTSKHEGKHSETRPLPTRIPQVRAFGFRELGIDEDVAKLLDRAFPDVQRPTLTQTEYIPAILEGKDVVVHDETGTGK